MGQGWECSCRANQVRPRAHLRCHFVDFFGLCSEALDMWGNLVRSRERIQSATFYNTIVVWRAACHMAVLVCSCFAAWLYWVFFFRTLYIVVSAWSFFGRILAGVDDVPVVVLQFAWSCKTYLA